MNRFQIDLYYKYFECLNKDIPTRIIVLRLSKDDSESLCSELVLDEEVKQYDNIYKRLEELCIEYGVNEVGIWRTDLNHMEVIWTDTVIYEELPIFFK